MISCEIQERKKTYGFSINAMDKQLPSSPAACSVSNDNMAESKDQGGQEQHRHSPQLLQIQLVIRQ
jgi:hypothetical protein